MTLRLPLIASTCAIALLGASVTAGAQTDTSSTPAKAAKASKPKKGKAAQPTTDATMAPGAPDVTAPASADATAAPATTDATTAAAPTTNPTVGGAPMLASKTIVENASAAPNLSTLVKAVQAAGLVETLSGPGPFTVFAPTDDAFTRLAPGTLTTLLKPENKASLVKVLTYHVVPGKLTLADLKAKAQAGGGTATLTTVAGQSLTVTYAANMMTLTDPSGNKSYVETPDVMQSNGVVHVVNGVLVPKLK